MKYAKFFNKNNCALALSNIQLKKGYSTVDIFDIVEDSETAEQLMNGLNNITLFEQFSIDRITENYTRLKSKDALGNVHYFKASF